jgi:multidrug efflux pump subunit AcrA (membrane-fusion protein)
MCTAFLISCGKSDQSKSVRSETAPRAVRVARAELRPMERALHVVGTLSAHEEVTVAAQVAGQIEKFHVDLGDRVEAGQEMALIDTTSYEALARASAANLAKAAAAAANASRNLAHRIAEGRDRFRQRTGRAPAPIRLATPVAVRSRGHVARSTSARDQRRSRRLAQRPGSEGCHRHAIQRLVRATRCAAEEMCRSAIYQSSGGTTRARVRWRAFFGYNEKLSRVARPSARPTGCCR